MPAAPEKARRGRAAEPRPSAAPGRRAGSSAVAGSGPTGTECAPGLVGQGHRDETRSPGWGRIRFRRDHDPPVELAVAEGAQLDLLPGKSPSFDVPALVTPGHCAIRLEAWRMANQGTR